MPPVIRLAIPKIAKGEPVEAAAFRPPKQRQLKRRASPLGPLTNTLRLAAEQNPGLKASHSCKPIRGAKAPRFHCASRLRDPPSVARTLDPAVPLPKIAKGDPVEAAAFRPPKQRQLKRRALALGSPTKMPGHRINQLRMHQITPRIIDPEPSPNRILRNILDMPLEILRILNPMFRISPLPNLTTGAELKRKSTLNELNRLFQRDILRRRKEKVNMVGHHHPPMETIPSLLPIGTKHIHQ